MELLVEHASLIDSPVVALVPRLSYRPGWSVEVVGDRFIIHAVTIDTDDPGTAFRGDHTFAIPALSDDEARQWIAECFDAVERHERREFLRLDGKQINPPVHSGIYDDMYGRQ